MLKRFRRAQQIIYICSNHKLPIKNLLDFCFNNLENDNTISETVQEKRGDYQVKNTEDIAQNEEQRERLIQDRKEEREKTRRDRRSSGKLSNLVQNSSKSETQPRQSLLVADQRTVHAKRSKTKGDQEKTLEDIESKEDESIDFTNNSLGFNNEDLGKRPIESIIIPEHIIPVDLSPHTLRTELVILCRRYERHVDPSKKLNSEGSRKVMEERMHDLNSQIENYANSVSGDRFKHGNERIVRSIRADEDRSFQRGIKERAKVRETHLNQELKCGGVSDISIPEGFVENENTKHKVPSHFGKIQMVLTSKSNKTIAEKNEDAQAINFDYHNEKTPTGTSGKQASLLCLEREGKVEKLESNIDEEITTGDVLRNVEEKTFQTAGGRLAKIEELEAREGARRRVNSKQIEEREVGKERVDSGESFTTIMCDGEDRIANEKDFKTDNDKVCGKSWSEVSREQRSKRYKPYGERDRYTRQSGRQCEGFVVCETARDELRLIENEGNVVKDQSRNLLDVKKTLELSDKLTTTGATFSISTQKQSIHNPTDRTSSSSQVKGSRSSSKVKEFESTEDETSQTLKSTARATQISLVKTGSETKALVMDTSNSIQTTEDVPKLVRYLTNGSDSQLVTMLMDACNRGLGPAEQGPDLECVKYIQPWVVREIEERAFVRGVAMGMEHSQLLRGLIDDS